MRVVLARIVLGAGWLVLALALVSCARTDSNTSESEKSEKAAKTYVLRGQVVRIDSTHQTATVKHERIEGWMEAMTMEFPVDPSEFGRLHAGDHIRATVFVKDLDFWIGDIHQEIGP